MQFHKNDEKSQREFIKIDRFLLARMRARVREGKYTVLQILYTVDSYRVNASRNVLF